MTKEQKCTSFPLAQELQKVAKENGFELPESEMWWGNTIGQKDQTCWRLYTKEEKEMQDTAMEYYPAYDILNDLCCKYAKEMFGEDKKLFKIYPDRNKKIWLLNYEGVSHTVLLLLQQNKKDEAEKYIMKVSILNPKNKL